MAQLYWRRRSHPFWLAIVRLELPNPMRRFFQNSYRLFRVVRVLGRHGVLPKPEGHSVAVRLAVALFQSPKDFEEGFGTRLSAALQELGPSFVKFGQSLAVRADLIGAQSADELAQLQDQLPPFGGDAATAIVEAELNKGINELFNRFDIKPIAAASIAQVHLAETVDGDQVAVKILRPDIEKAFAKDIDLFAWLANCVEFWVPGFARFKLRAVVAEFEETVSTELDLRLEAAAASALGDAMRDEVGFRVPVVDWKRTAHRVLTIERIDGIRIDDIERIDSAGLDRQEILKTSSAAFFQQVFRDGFFHADMHPGNMFVTEDGVLMPVDFGIMGRLDRATRYYLADMLMAFLRQDYQKVADIHFDAGLVPSDQSRSGFALAIRSVSEPIFECPMAEISIAQLLARLFQTAESFQMEVQPQLLLLQKTMLVAEGIGRKLDPNSNMWMLARPLIETWMRRHRGPEARLLEGFEDLTSIARRLPSMTDRLDCILSRLANESDTAVNRRSLWASVCGVRGCAPLVAGVFIIFSFIFIGIMT
ncbi:2-polyprenylphenol 6-hydroxylase [Alphaproteobacteria bacterium]|nr:2-polyprenylphenol 6-hydroxylase [Alphaproteobacteria bacterium]